MASQEASRGRCGADLIPIPHHARAFRVKSFTLFQVKAFSDSAGMAASSGAPARDDLNFITDVARVCGIEVAHKLQQRFGGSRLYVPSDPQPHHVLSQLVGLETARTIAKEVGSGGGIELPLGDFGALAIRRSLIERLCLAGTTVSEVCRIAKCSDRTVYNARARLRRRGKLR